MKLKKVEIQGFKTFVDHVTILFNAGITGIVGPNGCGKSNIVDAIRWVLGENNPRMLRGGMMEDVIFNGCETRPPLGMAEVTLTLDNEDGTAPSQYAAFPEISVTRRVFRDGESEYLINKTPCRLKDITDVFMGTGAGLYSIIEQGRISGVVSAKPEELRTFIEEAAGITFYRSRKRAALRRIEATQQNLVRVSDILSEISRQIKYLERQARKAERYRELRDRLRLLELNMTYRDIQQIDAQLQGFDHEKANLKTQLLGYESQSESVAAEAESLRLELHEWESKMQEAQKSLYEAGKSLAEQEKQQEYLLKERDDLKQRAVVINGDLERNHLKLSMTDEQLAAGTVELVKLREQNGSHRSHLETLEQTATSFEEQLIAARGQSDRLKSQLMQQLTKVTTLRNQLSSMQQLDAKHGEEHGRWLRERETLNLQYNQALTATQGFEQTKNEWQTNLQNCETQMLSLRQQLDTATQNLEELTEARQQCRDEKAQVGSRLESMLALQREGDLEQFMQVSQPVTQGALLGPLSQWIQVKNDYEEAIESFLGDKLNWVVTRDQADPAQLMLTILNTGPTFKNVPRATLIPASCAAPQFTINDLQVDTDNGIYGAISNLIQCESELKPLLRYLCGQATLVRDLQTAQKLAKNHQHHTFVTLQGEVLVGGAEVTAGHLGEKYQGILHRKREMQELSAKLEALQTQFDQLDNDLRQNQQQKTLLANQLDETNQQLQNLKVQGVALNKDLDRARSDCQRLNEQLQILDLERTQADSSQQELIEQRIRLTESLTIGEREHEELNRQENTLLESLRQLEGQLAQAQESWTQARVEGASAIEREEHLNQEQLRLQNDLEALRTTLNRQQEELQSIATRQHEGEQLLGGLATSTQILREQVVVLEGNFQTCQRGFQELSSKLQHAEMGRREAESSVHRSTRDLAELDFKLRELSVKREHAVTLMIDRWKVDLAAAAPEVIELNDKTETEVVELRDNMESMGEVNLGAVEEHLFLKDRFDFLSAQRNDLETSLDALQKTIRKIDTTTKQLFFDAFEAINKELHVMFPRLFGGGKAELVLIGDETVDPLERGMSIIAHPPGKRPQHINLLSGGEKSLTAAALIFAIFKYKPSPFSILDEIDAALDEENTRRLNRIAQEISAISQLVIITHNKRTMEVAQNLYGVTMEEAGVSKLVSVRLEDPAHRGVGKTPPPPSTPEPQAAVA